jgi:hypothetical protein
VQRGPDRGRDGDLEEGVIGMTCALQRCNVRIGDFVGVTLDGVYGASQRSGDGPAFQNGAP